MVKLKMTAHLLFKCLSKLVFCLALLNLAPIQFGYAVQLVKCNEKMNLKVEQHDPHDSALDPFLSDFDWTAELIPEHLRDNLADFYQYKGNPKNEKIRSALSLIYERGIFTVKIVGLGWRDVEATSNFIAEARRAGITGLPDFSYDNSYQPQVKFLFENGISKTSILFVERITHWLLGGRNARLTLSNISIE